MKKHSSHSKEDGMNSEFKKSVGIKLEEISTKSNDEEIESSECIYENSAYCKCYVAVAIII